MSTTTKSGPTAGQSDRPPPLDRAAAEALAGKICASAAEQAKANCQLLEFIGDFDAGAGWSWMSGMKSMAHWLAWSCSMSAGTAREHVRVARAMRKLPTVTAAFRRGELSYSKVREMSRVAGLIDEARLCSMARFATASQLARTMAAFRTAAGLRLREQERRRLQLIARDGGEYTGVSGRYPNDEAAVVGAAIQRARDLNGPPPPPPRATEQASRQAAASPSAASVSDEPDATPPYTDADAFLDICRHYLNTAVTDDESGEDRSLVVMEFAASQLESLQLRPAGDVPAGSSTSECDPAVPLSGDVPAGLLGGREAAATDHTNPVTSNPVQSNAFPLGPKDVVVEGWIDDQVCTVRGRGPAEPETAVRHACNGSVLGVIIDRHGGVLALGRTRRLVSKRQRRALMIRDQVCQFPGCHQDRHLEAHHRVSWADGGPTDLGNLLLLCRFHHTAVHEGGIVIDRSADADYQAARTSSTGWDFTLPDGTLLRKQGWRVMSAERLTSELIYQRQAVDHVGSIDDRQASTIRAVGGGAGFELRSCVDAVFGMMLDPDPPEEPDPDDDWGHHDGRDPDQGTGRGQAGTFGIAEAA